MSAVGRALLTGGLFGLLVREEEQANTVLRITDSRATVDSDGRYTNVIEVRVNGEPYKIAVFDAHIIHEES